MSATHQRVEILHQTTDAQTGHAADIRVVQLAIVLERQRVADEGCAELAPLRQLDPRPLGLAFLGMRRLMLASDDVRPRSCHLREVGSRPDAPTPRKRAGVAALGPASTASLASW